MVLWLSVQLVTVVEDRRCSWTRGVEDWLISFFAVPSTTLAKKLRQPRKPNIGSCMLERSHACATCARLSQFFGRGTCICTPFETCCFVRISSLCLLSPSVFCFFFWTKHRLFYTVCTLSYLPGSRYSLSFPVTTWLSFSLATHLLFFIFYIVHFSVLSDNFYALPEQKISSAADEMLFSASEAQWPCTLTQCSCQSSFFFYVSVMFDGRHVQSRSTVVCIELWNTRWTRAFPPP